MTVAMTMTEKILARGAGRESVRPGDLVLAKVDFAMGHDLTIPPAGKIMREQMGAERIWDPDRVAVTQDHFQTRTPAPTGRSTISRRGSVPPTSLACLRWASCGSVCQRH